MAGNKQLHWLSATELAALIRARQVSPVEAVQASLDRIDALNPRVNAFCTVVHEQAIAAARAAEAAIVSGAPLGPLHGVPIGIKDLTATAGIRTTMGSRLFADNVPAQDALLVQRLKGAGAVVVGKTNTPDMGHKGLTDNPLFGITRNPWNLDRVTGGSSGGAGAALAAGMVPLAEGSDGGGSIRIPAALNGVYGVKPTYGRVPYDSLGPFSSLTPFLHNGPMARTVTDAALMHQVMSGPHPSAPMTLPVLNDVLGGLNEGVKGLKVAFSPDLGYVPVDPQVRRAFAAAVRVFADLGCEVEEVNPGFDNPKENLERSFVVLWHWLYGVLLAPLPAEQLALLEPRVQDIVRSGLSLTTADYARAHFAREMVWTKVQAILDQYDFLICPTTACPAFPVDLFAPAEVDGQPIDPFLGWCLTYPFNMTGHPVASIPCGWSDDGMPIGMQIVGRWMDDPLVYRASRAFELQAPWAHRRPPLD